MGASARYQILGVKEGSIVRVQYGDEQDSSWLLRNTNIRLGRWEECRGVEGCNCSTSLHQLATRLMLPECSRVLLCNKRAYAGQCDMSCSASSWTRGCHFAINSDQQTAQDKGLRTRMRPVRHVSRKDNPVAW